MHVDVDVIAAAMQAAIEAREAAEVAVSMLEAVWDNAAEVAPPQREAGENVEKM